MAKKSSNPQPKDSTKITRANGPKPLIPKSGVTHSGRRSY